jgi:hypothetical protein
MGMAFFTDAGEQIASFASNSTATQSLLITIPGGTVVGTTKMRVMFKYNAAATGPCDNTSTYYDVEDYDVFIQAISITTQPTNQTICLNSSADFKVVAGGAEPISYQWKYNGSNVVNGTPAGAVYTGATTSTLTVGGTIAAGTYSPYTCYVSNAYGNVTSNSAQLTVSSTAAPSAPTLLTATPQYLCSGGSSTLTATVPTGTSLVWHTTSCDGVLAASPVSPTVTTSYYARSYNAISGCYSSCSSIEVGVMDVPVIITNPESTYGCNGTQLTFSIVATGAGLTYRWQENGVNIPLPEASPYSGVETETLTISDPTGLGGRTYRCVVTGQCGSATSTAATLNVLGTGMSGTYTVGTTGTYANLRLAFADINTRGLIGNVFLKVISSITDNNEASLSPWNNCGNNGYTVTVYPSDDVNATPLTVQGSVATSLITLNGADYVTFDGRVDMTGAANGLVLSNSNVAGSTIKFINDACFNTIRYCTIKGASNDVTAGVIWFSTATSIGNNNNLISYCDIRDDATVPRVGIFGDGTVGKENKNNTITNCNIYNFWRGTVSGTRYSCYGIYLKTGNSKWSILNNSLYQTSDRVGGFGYYGILISNSSGQEFIINGNYIGGKAPLCGGSIFSNSTTSTNSISFSGISLTSSTVGVSKIENNYIQNINFSTVPYPDAVYIITRFVGISASGRIDVSGNTIGDGTTTGSILIKMDDNSTYRGGTTAIIKDGDGVVTNNTIGSFTLSGTSDDQYLFSAIQITGTLINDVLISGNSIGGSVASSIQSAAAATPAVAFAGIYFGTDGNYKTTVSNNIVDNINIGSTSSIPFLLGLSNQGTGGNQTIVGNTIRNITTASANTSNSDLPCFAGIINNNNVTGGCTIDNNTIHSITSTSTAGVFVYGIKCYNASGTNTISKNYIHSFTTANNTVLKGVTLNSGTATLANNIISLGTGITTTSSIFAIESATSSSTSILFNSIYIGGSGVAATNTMSFNRSGTGTTDIRNNIFVNARSGGAGLNYCYYVPSITSLTSNYNIYSDGTTGALVRANGGDRTTLAAIQANTGPGDANSIIPDLVTFPMFTSTTDLHLLSTSQAIGKGLAGLGILNDFDGEQRKTTASPNGPCIGADERVAVAPNSYGIYVSDAVSGSIADCEIIATGGTPVELVILFMLMVQAQTMQM